MSKPDSRAAAWLLRGKSGLQRARVPDNVWWRWL